MKLRQVDDIADIRYRTLPVLIRTFGCVWLCHFVSLNCKFPGFMVCLCFVGNTSLTPIVWGRRSLMMSRNSGILFVSEPAFQNLHFNDPFVVGLFSGIAVTYLLFQRVFQAKATLHLSFTIIHKRN